MNDQKPDFRIFKAYEKARNYAMKRVVDINQTHCIWNIGKSYLVAVNGYDPRRHQPADMPIASKVITVTPSDVK